MSGLTINDETMQAVVSKAILEGISEEQKLSLVEQAVQYLITPPASTAYGAKAPTPLQQAFNEGVQRVSRTVVDELVKDDEISAAIDAGIRKALVTEMTDDAWLRDTIVNAVSSKVADVFRSERGW